MKEFVKGESFKLKGCRKTWTVIKLFKHKGKRHCVAASTLTKDSSIERLGIFSINEHGEVYQRV